jgi:hypothetical protein
MTSIRSFFIPSQAQRNDPQYFVIPTEAQRSERSGGTCFCLQLQDRSRLFLPLVLPLFGSRH